MTNPEAWNQLWAHLECATQLNELKADWTTMRPHLLAMREAAKALDRPLIKTGRTPGNEKPASSN